MKFANDTPWIRFRVGPADYALPLEGVAEVTVARRPRLIPFVPLDRAGVMNIKGEPLLALNGGALLRGETTSSHRQTLVLERGELRAGLLVDAVSRIERALDRRGQEGWPAPGEAPPGPPFVRWLLVDGEPVGLVDLDAFLGSVADLLTGPAETAQHRREDPWPNAF